MAAAVGDGGDELEARHSKGDRRGRGGDDAAEAGRCEEADGDAADGEAGEEGAPKEEGEHAVVAADWKEAEGRPSCGPLCLHRGEEAHREPRRVPREEDGERGGAGRVQAAVDAPAAASTAASTPSPCGSVQQP